MLWKYRKILPIVVPIMLNAGLQMAGVEIQLLGFILIGLAILGAIYFIYSVIKEKHLPQLEQIGVGAEHPQGISNILSIERQEPSKLPPLWATVIGTLAALLLLSFCGFQTYLVASGVLVAKLNWEWMLFYLLFGAMPLWLLLEPITDREYYKTGKSATAVEVTFIVKGDITDIFNKCLNITEMLKAKITKATAPSVIKARTSKTRISVELQPNNGDVQIKVLCDAIWVTVKVGKGRNQKYADEFQKHLIDEFRVYKPDTIEGIQPKSYDKRDVIIGKEEPIENEPEISIDIDKCSVSNYGQSDQAIEVALTLKVKSPPVNITDLQLYMGDEMLELLSPAMPITQRTNKECYMTKYKLSLRTIYEVDKDKRDKYRIYVVTMGQKFSSKVFSINNP